MRTCTRTNTKWNRYYQAYRLLFTLHIFVDLISVSKINTNKQRRQNGRLLHHNNNEVTACSKCRQWLRLMECLELERRVISDLYILHTYCTTSMTQHVNKTGRRKWVCLRKLEVTLLFLSVKMDTSSDNSEVAYHLCCLSSTAWNVK